MGYSEIEIEGRVALHRGWKLEESESNEADDDGACEFSGFWINREAIERRKEKCPLWH